MGWALRPPGSGVVTGAAWIKMLAIVTQRSTSAQAPSRNSTLSRTCLTFASMSSAVQPRLWAMNGCGGNWQLRRIISEYVEHYHRERHHQGLENQLIMAPAGNENSAGPVQCRERLGGTLSFYYRDAA